MTARSAPVGFAPYQPGNIEFMSNQDSGTTPDETTRAEEQTEASAPHQADRPPTAEEEQAAPDHASPETGKKYQEMSQTGAQVKGEGELP